MQNNYKQNTNDCRQCFILLRLTLSIFERLGVILVVVSSRLQRLVTDAFSVLTVNTLTYLLI